MATRGGGLQQGGLAAALTGVGRDNDADALTPTSRSIVSDVLRRNTKRFADGGSVSEDIIEDVMPDPLGDVMPDRARAATSSLSQARARLSALQKKREARSSTDRWLALAQGMLSPTKTGGFGESLGYSAAALGKVSAAERKEDVQLAKVEAALGPSSAQRMFDDLTQNLDPEQLQKAREMKLGLVPRMVGSSGLTTAMTEGLTELLARSEEILAERKTFAEKTGASRAKVIDKSYETILGLNQHILNLDKAYAALKSGAVTGFIPQYLPSIRESTIIFDQIRKELGLDIIGATTFGALSKGELDLALATAVPEALPPDELMQWIQNRKAAQLKLKDYLMEQVDFLDKGGSIAGWLREKERGLTQTQQEGGAEAGVQEGQTATGPQGEKVVFTNGQWVPM